VKNKLKDRNELISFCKQMQEKGKKTGFTSGVFDLIHAGHVTYLEQAKEACDILIVGVNSDSSVREIKGESRPVNKEQDRAKMLAALVRLTMFFYSPKQTIIAM